MARNHTKLSIFSTLLCYLLPSAVSAEVLLDGTIGSFGAGSVQAGNGFTYDINDSLGEVTGDNLFFSFETFAVDTGESARFSSSVSVENVISRITGGSPLAISGDVISTVVGADLWFLSPGGVLIGSGASVDVPGGLTFTTASSLVFQDGGELIASGAGSVPVLSASTPALLRFLAPTTSQIRIEDARIQVGPGDPLSFIGGNVEADGLTLANQDLELTIAALGAGGEFNLLDSGYEGPSADVLMRDSDIQIDTAENGAIRIVGGDIIVARSTLRVISNSDQALAPILISGTSTTLRERTRVESIVASGAGDGPDIDIRARTGRLSILGDNTRVRTRAIADNATTGSVMLSGENVTLSDRARIEADSLSFANVQTGDVSVIADDSIEISDFAEVSNEVAQNSTGGTVQLTADTVIVASNAKVTGDSGDGAGGRIEILASLLNVSGGAITNETSFVAGQGIGITVDSLTVSDEGLISTQTFETAPGGAIDIAAARVSLSSGGRISASALNRGQGGSIAISAREAVVIDGSGSSELPTGLLARAGDRDLEETLGTRLGFGEGDGGTIRVTSPSVTVTGGGVISSDTTRVGNAGDIFIDAQTLQVTGPNSSILAETDGTGNAGQIVLGDSAPIGRVDLAEGASVASTTKGQGDAGSIDITANVLALSGTSAIPSISSSSVVPDGDSPSTIGRAGQITINGGDVSIAGRGRISTDSGGNQPAGSPQIAADLILNVERLSLQGDPAASSQAISELVLGNVPTGDFVGITSNSSSDVRGGNINVNASTSLDLRGAVLSASASGTGGGGDVIVGSPATSVSRIVVDGDSGLLARAVTNNGGNVFLFAEELLRDFESVFSADSNQGDAGVVEVIAPDQNLNAAVANLDADLLDVSSLIREVCDASPASERSKLTLEGAGGVPEIPDADLLSDLPINLENGQSGLSSGNQARQLISWVIEQGCGGHAP